MCVAAGLSSSARKYARTAAPCCPKFAWLMPKFSHPRAYLGGSPFFLAPNAQSTQTKQEATRTFHGFDNARYQRTHACYIYFSFKAQH